MASGAAGKPNPKPKALSGRYTNWRGQTKKRTVVPIEIWYGTTPWHPAPGWLLKAEDETGETKDFALKDFNFRKE